jgi:uncharacterized protein YjiS (DUF1127 family)
MAHSIAATFHLPHAPVRLAHLADTLRLWRRRSQERRQLALMDSRDLRDIGLTPTDQAFLLGKPVWRP